MNFIYYFYSYIYGYFTLFFICVYLSWEMWMLKVIKIGRSWWEMGAN